MNKEEKTQTIEELKGKISGATNFYLANTQGLNVDEVNQLRRLCFENDIEMRMAKNTFIFKALESIARWIEFGLTVVDPSRRGLKLARRPRFAVGANHVSDLLE